MYKLKEVEMDVRWLLLVALVIQNILFSVAANDIECLGDHFSIEVFEIEFFVELV